MTPSPVSPDWGVRVFQVGPSSPTPLAPPRLYPPAQAAAIESARRFFRPAVVEQEPQGAPARPTGDA